MPAATRPAAPHARAQRTPESYWISLRYFNYYRIVVAALFLGATLIYDDELNLGSHNLALFRYVVAGYVFLGFMFQGILRNLRDHFDLQLTLHVFCDTVAITLLMGASGGIRSGLGVMLLISLTAAALVAPRRLTFLYASVAAIALLLEQTYWVLVHDAPTLNYLQPGLLSIGFFASAGMTSWLAQRVATNEALVRQRGRELETQMRVNELVIQDMHDGVLVVDRDGRVVQHNPQAQRLLGADPLRGGELARLLPGLAARWREWRAGDPGAPHAGADLELNGRAIRARFLDTGTDEDYTVLFIEDVTRSREQAQQLKLAALGRLTANIAHEIRNPLSAISHAAELLGEEKREEDRERLERIVHDNTRRLERLVADVLQLNRRDRAVPDRFQVNQWLVGFIEEFLDNERVPPERLQLQLGREAWIEFDREHLHQVMWNLLRNAVRHAREEPRSVRIQQRVYADQVELNIIDNGPGVPPAHQGQLFEPFFTTDSKGTGLGLYLARELCSANRAVLDYADDLAGAHFRIVCREVAAA